MVIGPAYGNGGTSGAEPRKKERRALAPLFFAK
jgi:hypothetical protein